MEQLVRNFGQHAFLQLLDGIIRRLFQKLPDLLQVATSFQFILVPEEEKALGAVARFYRI